MKQFDFTIRLIAAFTVLALLIVAQACSIVILLPSPNSRSFVVDMLAICFPACWNYRQQNSGCVHGLCVR